MTTQSLTGDATTTSEILTERSGAVLTIQLNRPAKKNAMTSSMYIAMADLLDNAGHDDSVRVVVWHGAGDSFSAGNDLEDFLNNPFGPADSPQSRLMHSLVAFEKPLIAAVKGVAIGGGTTMLGHCDFVYAGETTKFQMPFINLALNPEFGSSHWLPLRVGYLRAAELIFLAQPFDAARAAQLGLVTKVVPDQQLLTTAYETAKQLAEKPVHALQACKRLLKHGTREPTLEAIGLENEAFAAGLASPEAKAVFAGFLAKHQKPQRS